MEAANPRRVGRDSRKTPTNPAAQIARLRWRVGVSSPISQTPSGSTLIRQFARGNLAAEGGLNQLKLDYEKYFIGNRPTEPSQLRSEIQKSVIKWSNTRITNSALRFKFNSLNGRYQAFKRQWDRVLRQVEAGADKRHVFRANLHDRERGLAPGENELPAQGPIGATAAAAPGSAATSDSTSYRDKHIAPANTGDANQPTASDLFETYRAALLPPGQDSRWLSRSKLPAVLAK